MSKVIEAINKKNYIELNSTYRNRTIYPFQSSFKVNIKNQGEKDTAQTSLDPVSDGDSVYVWKGRLDVSFTMSGNPNAPVLNLPPTTSAFKGQFLTDLTTDESSLITFYSEFGGAAFLETSFGDSWAVGDTGIIYNTDDNQHIQLTMRVPVFDNQFVGQYLYDMTIDEYRLITAFDATFQYITLETPFGGTWTETDEYTIVKEQAISTGQVVFPTDITNSTVTLPAGESSIDNIYVGQFIKLIQFTGPNILVTYSRQIISYNGTTKVVSFYPSIEADFALPTSQVWYQIIPFTEDQSSYLNTFPTKETALYRITLPNLILPNQPISHPNGGTITNYPYVYVVFTNTMNRTNSLINSNNPNSRSVTFRCPIEDNENFEFATFLKLRSEMINVILYDPTNDLLFEVYLPDGTLFKTLTVDRTSPNRPDPLLQISCLVSLEFIQEMNEEEYYELIEPLDPDIQFYSEDEYEPDKLIEELDSDVEFI